MLILSISLLCYMFSEVFDTELSIYIYLNLWLGYGVFAVGIGWFIGFVFSNLVLNKVLVLLLFEFRSNLMKIGSYAQNC